MPWAWGLAWVTIRSPGRAGRPGLVLAAVLAAQVLPGHFQLAFNTEVGVLALAVLGSGRGRRREMLAVFASLAALLPLAAAQLVPTMALARLSGGSRGFEYLSGFAATPVHLVSFVVPGLFHRSPLWRPLAWDLFHTSPEEYLGYVGLVPLFLAGRAVLARGRSSPEVRVLALVALLFTMLSLGPYIPGFRWLISLPGFSFFRAPARWNLGASLALAILAGMGFDLVRVAGWRRRAILGWSVGAITALGLVVGGFELALAATSGPGWPSVAQGFDRGLQTLPWAGESDSPNFRAAMTEAYRPQTDLRVQTAQARLTGQPFPPAGLILARERWEIYARELTGSAVVLAAFLVVGLTLARRPRSLAWGLGVLVLADLVSQGRARPFDLGPIRSLVEQSPVLTRVAAQPRGSRTLDPGQNLFLVAGAESVAAYRTLNLPTPDAWLARARSPGLPVTPSTHPDADADALRVLGIDARVVDPLDARTRRETWRAKGWGQPADLIRDPALAGWLFGADFVRLNRADTFEWVAGTSPTVQAWRVDSERVEGPTPREIPAILRAAAPLTSQSSRPETFTVDYQADGSPDPRWVVVSRTFDPEWSGVWSGPSGATRAAPVRQAFGVWQGVDASGLPPGRWTLVLHYEGRMARLGLAISAVAWAVWLGWLVGHWRRGRQRGASLGLEGEQNS